MKMQYPEIRVKQGNLIPLRINMIIILLVIVTGPACVKEDFTKIDSSFQWNPEISLPIGYATIDLETNFQGYDSSQLGFDFITQFPDWALGEYILLQDTIRFDLSSSFYEFDHIEQLIFRINSWNYFPVNSTFNLYLAESSLLIVDSLSLELDPADVRDDGKVRSPGTNSQDFVFDDNRVNTIQNVDLIIITGKINNFQSDTSLLRYYTDYYINFQMGVQAKLNEEYSGF